MHTQTPTATPLPTSFHEPHFTLEDYGSFLVLGMNSWVYLFWWPIGGLLLGVGAVGFLLTLNALLGQNPAFWKEGQVFCLIPSTLGVWAGMRLFVLPRFRFDRNTGLFSYRPPWSWKERIVADRTMPLESILGLQIIPGEPKTYEEGDPFQTYQLNVWHDSQRLNLSDHTDLAATRRTGQTIAAFLGVPVRDSTA